MTDNKKQIIPKRILASLISSVSAGVVPRSGAPYIAIGRQDEIAALLSDLELMNEGGGSMRFLVGRYGSGKSPEGPSSGRAQAQREGSPLGRGCRSVPQGDCQLGRGERRVVHGGRAAPSRGRSGSALGQQASGSPISFLKRLSRWVCGVRRSPKGLSQSAGERTKIERRHLEMFMEN